MATWARLLGQKQAENEASFMRGYKFQILKCLVIEKQWERCCYKFSKLYHIKGPRLLIPYNSRNRWTGGVGFKKKGVRGGMRFHLLPFPQHKPRSSWNSVWQVTKTLPGKSVVALTATPTPRAQSLHQWVRGRGVEGTSAHPAAPCHWIRSCRYPAVSCCPLCLSWSQIWL